MPGLEVDSDRIQLDDIVPSDAEGERSYVLYELERDEPVYLETAPYAIQSDEQVLYDIPWFSEHEISSELADRVKMIPPDGDCDFEACNLLCKMTRYREQYLSQCIKKDCYCFKKDELFPPSIKALLKSVTLFGIPQQSE